MSPVINASSSDDYWRESWKLSLFSFLNSNSSSLYVWDGWNAWRKACIILIIFVHGLNSHWAHLFSVKNKSCNNEYTNQKKKPTKNKTNNKKEKHCMKTLCFEPPNQASYCSDHLAICFSKTTKSILRSYHFLKVQSRLTTQCLPINIYISSLITIHTVH